MIITASGCGSRKDTLEDTITVVDATDENVSDKAELDTTLAHEENHDETEQTTVATTESTEQAITETTEKIVQTEQATTDNNKQSVKQTTTKEKKTTNSATTGKKNPVKEEQTTAKEEETTVNEIPKAYDPVADLMNEPVNGTVNLEKSELENSGAADTSELDKKCEKLLDEIDVTKELIARLIKENAMQAQNQEEYLKKYESLAQRVEKLKSRYEILQQKRERRLYQADTLSAFLFALRELDILDIKFTPTLWHTTVDKVTVNADGSVVFSFKNGSEITV